MSNFDPEFAESVEAGDMFACEVCHDFVSDTARFCPYCHEGVCMLCGKPLELCEIGDRDFEEPSYMTCRECFAHENGLPAPKPAPTVVNLIEALKEMLKDKKGIQC